MLKCKDVAHLASDFLDHNASGTLSLKIRLHLMICAQCRRFVRHLRITNEVARGLVDIGTGVNAEQVLARIKARASTPED